MNTQIQRGLVQSGTPLTPSGHLQGEVAGHFQGSLVVPQHFRPFFCQSAVIQGTRVKQGCTWSC